MQWRVLDVKADKLLEPTARWSAPTEVPAVCSAEDLKLEKSSSPKFICDALIWLAKYKDPVYVLILFTLDNFTPVCLRHLLQVLKAKNIISLNLGEPGKHLDLVHYEQRLTRG